MNGVATELGCIAAVADKTFRGRRFRMPCRVGCSRLCARFSFEGRKNKAPLKKL